MQNAQDVAMHISGGIAKMGPYRLLSDGRRAAGVRVHARPEVKNYTVFDVSEHLRQRGWLIPAYTFPENREDLSVLRIVVRAGMTLEMADQLLTDLREETQFLRVAGLTAARSAAQDKRTAFAH